MKLNLNKNCDIKKPLRGRQSYKSSKTHLRQPAIRGFYPALNGIGGDRRGRECGGVEEESWGEVIRVFGKLES